MTHHFWTQNGAFAPPPQKKFLSEKPLIQFPCISSPFPLCKVLKKLLEQIQIYDGMLFLGPKWKKCPE